MKKLIFATLLLGVFAACSKEDEPAFVVEYEVVDFESAKLNADGYLWGKSLATEQEELDYMGQPMLSNIYYGSVYDQHRAQLYTYFSDYGHTYDTWNGFVVSNRTDRTTAGFTNDKSVYAEGGAGGSKQFAMACYGAWTAGGKGIPTIRFSSATKVSAVSVAHSTYAYIYFTKDIADAQKPDFKVVVIGYNGTTETGKASMLLTSGATVKSGWESLDLSTLGAVTRLDFMVECKDEMVPLYFCIDNLICQK